MNTFIPIDEEYTFESGLIVSSTNPEGIITHANRKFCEIAGYTKDELKGQNHNIIRHQDMPKAAFRNMWDTIKQGKEWSGVVKNLRKDGRYYWVYSHIIPIVTDGNITGYTAARRPATANEVIESTLLYKELLEKEKNQKEFFA
ncbi:MAG TPA: aerotaxis receptor Aer [Sulfurovum sp. UBA12169]|nr:MAG TPA: aerotaxis receptor Aer [Sulfurovum sp. UBA12169]